MSWNQKEPQTAKSVPIGSQKSFLDQNYDIRSKKDEISKSLYE